LIDEWPPTPQPCSLPNHKPLFFTIMNDVLLSLPPLAAIGYSLIYLIFGGGLFGAGVIFIIAKMFGK
jgi:hypothetical protein